MDFLLMAKPLQLKGLPPSPREAHSMIALDAHRILVFGGGCISQVFGPQQFNDLFLLDLKEAQWSYIESKGIPPSPRTGQCAVLLEDGRALFFGGSSMTEGYHNDVHILDTKDWTWSQPEVSGIPPSPRDKHSACLIGSRMYVFGGFGPPGEDGSAEDGTAEDNEQADSISGGSEDEGGSSDEEDDGQSMSFTWFDDLHVLDINSMAWERKQTKGVKPTPRAAHAAFITSITDQVSVEPCDRMMVFGGRDPSGRQNDLFSLDLKTLEWKKEISEAPAARSFHVWLPLGGSQIAVSYGGIGADGGLFKGLEVLNLKTMKWAGITKCGGAWPALRGASAMVAVPSSDLNGGWRLVIFGGSCSSEDKEIAYFNDVYSIDASPLLKNI